MIKIFWLQQVCIVLVSKIKKRFRIECHFLGDLVEGGTESLATALLWAFVILSTQKDAQYQIVEEIASFASEHQRLPTFADRDALPFLVSVQKECMRFRPITPFGEFHEIEQDGM